MNFSRISNFIFLILFFLGIYFKYPHINPDGLLYIDNAIKFNGNFQNLNLIYGLPAYPIIIYYLGNIFDSYYLAVYLINLICYSIIIYTLIRLTNILIINKYLNGIIILLFLTTSLMSTYLGLTIRDYLGWTFLILSFYNSLKFSYSSKNKFILLTAIYLFFGSFFRIELLIYLFIIPIYLYLKFGNRNKFKINSLLLIFFAIAFSTFFFIINNRTFEIINHAIKFFESIGSINISHGLDALLFLLKKFISIIPYFFYTLMIFFFYYKYLKKSSFNQFRYKDEYMKCISIYFLITFILSFIYYVNSNVFSSRYFIGILLIAIPIFCYFLINIFSKNKKIRYVLILLLSLNIFFNINSNFKYLNDTEKNVANFLNSKDIDAESVYIVDNRILFYMGNLSIEKKNLTNLKFSKSHYKYFVFKKKELDQINYHRSDSCYNLELIPKTKNKYYLVEKRSSC